MNMNEPKRMDNDRLERIKSWLAERLPISKATCAMLNEHLAAIEAELAAAQAEISEWKHRAVGGTCRALSEGSECQCSLCARDRHIAELEAALAASKAECSRLIAVRDAADARVRRLDEELYDQKRLRESEAAVACSVWRAHEQQFEAQQARLVEALAHIERLRTCVIDESSSRVCRLGTRGCVNTHDEERQ